MTYEQAHIYIKLFILQHYDKNIEGVIPLARHSGKVSSLYRDALGNYRNDDGIFFALEQQEHDGDVNIHATRKQHFIDGIKKFDILDYINLKEEE